MVRKVALLVGVGTYGSGLKPLQCPANGVTELHGILADPAIGGFDQVIPLVDPDVGTMRSRIGEVFSRLTKQDLVLFYFTGHGIKDMTGEFYLTTSQTQLFDNGRLNPGTAVEAEFLKRVIGNCYAQRKVIILDCCFGAAFGEGFLTMDDGSVDVEADLGGEGWVVLTAATARNYALEQEGEPLSVYTRYLVEGLKTGAAAQEGKDYVYVRDLHNYVQAKVQTAAPTMSPTIFNARQGESITLAKVVIGNPELKFRKAVERYIDTEAAEITLVGKRYLKNLALSYGLDAQRIEGILDEELRPLRTRRNHLREYEEAYQEAVEYYSGLPERARRELRDLQRILGLRDEDVEKIHVRIPIPAPAPVPPPLNLTSTSVSASAPAPSSTPTSKPIEKPSPVKTKPVPTGFTQPQSSQQTRPTASSQPGKNSRRKFLTWAGWGGGGLIVFASVRPLLKPFTPSPQDTPRSSGESLPQTSTSSSEASLPQESTSLPEPVSVDLDNLPTKEFEVVTVNDTGEIEDRQTKSASYFIEKLGEDLELVMLKIPGGKFLMGQTEAEKQALIQQYGEEDYETYLAVELPQHEVNLSEFWIGQFQITQAQYQAVMGENPSNFLENGANRPVELVIWNDAAKFCEVLSKHTGRTYRLPSEAEWEYACRAGTTTPFHFGATITTGLANYDGGNTYGAGPNGEDRQQTTEVGSFPPNAFGLYDMHGNVLEWCQDVWHSNYKGALTDGSAWMVSGEQDRRVLRGGSCLYKPAFCRSACRIHISRGDTYLNVGFRVVWVPA